MITRRTLLAGIIYTALVETFLANMPLSVRTITVIYYARVIAYHMMPFIASTPNGDDNFAAQIWQFDILHDPQLLEHPSVPVCLLALLGGSFVLAAVGSLLCWRKEFYVKTPEKTA
jgi:hypothetical protein